MARTNKVGLDYFPFDVDFFEDDKIQLIEAEFGTKGVTAAIKLLCKIYKSGYYYKWGDDECLLFTKNAGASFVPEFINELVAGLVRRCFFDKRCYDSFGILTSSGIQQRYFDATARYKKVTFIAEYLLVNLPERNNVIINRINVCINPINVNANATKENEKESKKENESETEISSPPMQSYSEYLNQGAYTANAQVAYGDLTAAQMLLMTDVSISKENYFGASYFERTREELSMAHHMDAEMLQEWGDVFVTQLIRTGKAQKTLQDFAQHFSNWLPKQDLNRTPKQALEYEKRQSSTGGKPAEGLNAAYKRKLAGFMEGNSGPG